MRLIMKSRFRTAAVAVIVGMLFGIVPGTAGAAPPDEDYGQLPPGEDRPLPDIPDLGIPDHHFDLPEGDSNRCVDDVEAQFERLGMLPGTDNRSPSGRFRVRRNKNAMLPPDPPDRMPNIKWRHGQHVQGFNRIDVGDDTWFAMTNGSNRKDAGIAMVHLGRSVPGWGGERIVPPYFPRDMFRRSDPPADMAVRYYYPAGGPDGRRVFETDHPGGLQVVGSHVFVPYKAEGSGRVDIWDMSDPAHGRFVQTVTVPDWEGSNGFFTYRSESALYVAAARTGDGSYLMMINRGNYGETTFMRSEGDRITPSMRWNLVRHMRFGKDYKRGKTTYQNANFVTECGTGQLYLVGLRQSKITWDSDNVAHLLRVETTGSGGFRVVKLNRIEPDGSDGDWCDLRGGGGIYVTPRHEMILYCSQGRDVRGNGNTIKFSEHTVNY